MIRSRYARRTAEGIGKEMEIGFETRRDTFRRLLDEAKRSGLRIRQEWLGGETGGCCEIHGIRWLFLDTSLSIEEQIGQLRDALRKEVSL